MNSDQLMNFISSALIITMKIPLETDQMMIKVRLLDTNDRIKDILVNEGIYFD